MVAEEGTGVGVGDAPLLRELDGMARNALKTQVRCSNMLCFLFSSPLSRDCLRWLSAVLGSVSNTLALCPWPHVSVTDEMACMEGRINCFNMMEACFYANDLV